MSLNNVSAATGLVPQLATNSMGGQIFIIPNQPFSYYVPRPMLEPHHAALPPPQPHQTIQHRFMHHQQHQFLAAPAAQTPPQAQTNHAANVSLTSNGSSSNHVINNNNSISNNSNNNSVGNNVSRSVQSQHTQPRSKDQTNAKIRNIKEKCISHYIDGQLIIETSKPLTEKKLKSSKKRKLQQQQQQQKKRHNQQASQQQQQQSSHQPQHQQQPAQLPMHQQTMPAPHIQPAQPPQLPIPQLHAPLQTPPQPHQHLQPSPHHSSHSQATTPTSQHLPIMPPKAQAHVSQQQPRQITNSNGQQGSSSQSQPAGSKDVARLRAEMPNWSVDDVVKFIEKHEDIRQYSSKFAEDEVDGKALQLMIDRNLNFQILTSMFKHGPAMKIEATLSKYKME